MIEMGVCQKIWTNMLKLNNKITKDFTVINNKISLFLFIFKQPILYNSSLATRVYDNLQLSDIKYQHQIVDTQFQTL